MGEQTSVTAETPPPVDLYEECPHCFGPVFRVATEYRGQVKLKCWQCEEELAKWQPGMTRWELTTFDGDSLEADILAAQRYLRLLEGDMVSSWDSEE